MREVSSGRNGTTNPDVIRELLARDGKKAVLVTYRSLQLVADIVARDGYEPDVVCYDEAHRISDATRTGIAHKLALSSKRAYYFTATPTQALRQHVGEANELFDSLPAAIKDGVCKPWDWRVMMVMDKRRMSTLEANAVGYFTTRSNRILLKCGLAIGGSKDAEKDETRTCAVNFTA